MTTDSIAQHKLPETIMKRDGSEEKFDRSKISNAIYNSLRASGEYKDADINEFTGKLLKSVLRELKARNDGRLHVEDVQDIIENKLMDKGLHETARHFIKYRFLHKINRENADDTTLVDCNQTIDEYVGFTDWRIKANSNTTYSNAGLVNNTAGKVIANYWLDKVYSPEEGAAHRNGDYHIHDLDSLSGYCFTGDTKILLRDGDTPTIKELADKHGTHSSFAVLAVDANGKTVIGTGHNARLVKKDADLVAVKLSSSATVRCTPDHEFMLPDGSYKQAKDLEPGEELKSVRVNGYYHVESVTELEEKEDVYCLTVYIHGNFALEAGVFVHNCAGWNLRALLNEGFNGVRSRVNSRPPKHFREALGQMANFLGILQSEWAGAQAFSSFDTFLAPYVFRDQLSYEEVKKAIRGFVYNLNVPSRWGQCVPTTYKCQLSDGSWKSVDELSVGDTINVFDITTGSISTDTLTHINKYDAKEKMHAYTGENGGYFEVTPNHRVVIKTENGYEIKESAAILEAGVSVLIPTPNGEERYTVKEVTSSCDTVWCPTTNTGTFVCMTDEGYVFITGNSPFTNVTIDWTVPQDLQEQFPTKGDNHIFADIADNEELMAIAKERGVDSLEDMCYKHFQPEMDIIQKAYYEVMTEGDSTGQPFTFPIPTVNITEDFDWEGKNVPILFENAAKIGSSYFQNFVGSQYKIDENGNRVEDEEAYKPSAVRSMAFTPTQEFVYKDNEGRVTRSTLAKIYAAWEANMATDKGCKYEFMFNGKFYPITEMFKIDYSEYDRTKTIVLDNGYSFGVSVDHKCLVYDPVNKKTYNKLSQDIVSGDLIPVASKKWDTPSTHGSYEAGRVIGYYLAEGWNDDCRVYFAININREDIVNDIKTFFESLGIEVVVDKQDAVNIYKVTAYGSGAVAYVHQFVTGKTAKQKRLYRYTWNTSTAFRQGLFDGYVETDGCGKDSNVVAHTTNKDLCDDLICLASSLGIVLKFRVNKNNTRYFKADKSDKVTFTSYKLYRFASTPTNGVHYIPVREVKDVTRIPQFVYNFTIGNDDHLVELSNGIISPQCCRLQLDLNELRKRGNGLFGSAESTGSTGVVTINLARLGYLYKGDKEGLYKRLDQLMDMAKSTLEKKRAIITDLFERGLYPYTKRYLPGGFNNHFSTIGVNGGNEMIRNFTNDEYDITTEWGHNFAEDLLNHIRSRLKQYQNETGNLYNLEAAPGEGATHRFAREDLKRYPDIIQAGCKEKGQMYYTNSTQLPSWYTQDLFKALKMQDKLQTRYTGGCVEAGNYVITDRGRILIDELCNNKEKYEGIKVISYNQDTKKSEWDLVTDFHKIDVSDKDKIRIKGNASLDITTSDWHPFFVVTPEGQVEERRADELKPGDYLLQNSDSLLSDSRDTEKLTEDELWTLNVCGIHYTHEGDTVKLSDTRVGEHNVVQVTEVSKVDVEDNMFYDLTTEKNHNYLCGKLCYTFIHNTVFHMYMSEAISSPEACRDIVRKVLTNFKMPYITVTPLFSVCDKHGYLKGQHDHCPLCDEEILEKYSE